MKKLQDFIDAKEKSKIKIKIKPKTPFRDFVEEREDLSLKFDNLAPDFFLLEGGYIKYHVGDNYIPFLKVDEEKRANVILKSFSDRLVWRYINETLWHDIDMDDVDIIVENDIIEYKTDKHWAKISVPTQLLSEEAGLPGKDGKDGEHGRDGTDGRDGSEGPQGKQGKTGEKGIPGKTGATGRAGRDGTDGISGQDGISGKDGKTGKKGKDGRDGRDGKDGQDGKKGDTGNSGKDGKDGLNGTDGITGRDGKPGKDGLDGKNGSQGKTGRAGKTGATGKDGKDGRDGKDGIQGIQGPPGQTVQLKENTQILEGPSGQNGLDGRDGVDGKDGIDGKDGQEGKTGKQGIPGVDGRHGRDGKNGVDGREVELKAEGQKFFWKYADEEEWRFLVDFEKKSSELDRFKEIMKKSSADDPVQDYGQSIYPMLPGYSVGAPGPVGADGAGVEMTEDAGILYWRNIGDEVWIELVNLNDFVPEVPPGEGITIAKNTVELGTGISKLDFLTDGEITIAGSVATITLGEDMKYTVLLDFVDDGDYIYKGEAVPGSSGTDEGSSIWRISRTYIDPVTDDIDILWADGVITFDKIWTDHLTYTYS